MRRKHWEKEKLLVTRNFSFSPSVFNRLALQTYKNEGLFGKGLNPILSNKQLTHGAELSFESCRKFENQAKSFVPCQLQWTAKADMGQYFSQMH